jgi:TusA-related sulfurtransferase
MKAEKGQVIEVKGTHKASQKEVPMAVNSLGLELLEESVDDESVWHIYIKK